MELVSSDFKSIVEDMRAKVAAAKDSNQTTGTVRADAKLLGQQYQEVKVKNFKITSDEPAPSGGTDKGPTPLDFFAASVGFCENVMFTRHAALHGGALGPERTVRDRRDKSILQRHDYRDEGHDEGSSREGRPGSEDHSQDMSYACDNHKSDAGHG